LKLIASKEVGKSVDYREKKLCQEKVMRIK